MLYFPRLTKNNKKAALFGGRLSKTDYDINGAHFTLTPNDHDNVLHSGINGFDAVNWHGAAPNDEKHTLAIEELKTRFI